MHRSGWIGPAAVGAALLAGCTLSGPPAADVADPPSGGAAASGPVDDNEPSAPPGWRWESYQGVELAVPGYFGWGNGGQRIGQWCVRGDGAKTPIVGRPGPVTLVGCLAPHKQPDPSTLLEHTGTVVSFTGPLRAGRHAGRSDRPVRTLKNDRLTVTLAGVRIDIVAGRALRERIAATVHTVAVDHHGCPSTDPASADPGRRPRPGVDVSTLSGVVAISVCRYAVSDGFIDAQGLVSSLRLEGQAASDALEAVAAAPAGGGPDRPQSCLKRVSYGGEMIVLRVTSDAGTSQVYLRYSGCDHNGFDDGVTVRRLTADAVRPLVAGPNQVLSASGPVAKFRMLRPDLR